MAKMQIRLRHGGMRVQNYVKVFACILAGVVYFAFLFRESLNAYELKKDKLAEIINAGIKSKKQEQRPRLSEYSAQLKHAATARLALTAAPAAVPAAVAEQRQPLQLIDASTLNPVYEYSEEIQAITERDLQARRQHLNEVCLSRQLLDKFAPNPWEFFISPGHNLMWCNVFKAASSTWMYYFNILAGYDIKYLQRTKLQPIELARRRFPRPETFELYDSLPASLSFLFVREPFERLLSAYRDKLEGSRNTYYKPLGQKIIAQIRNKSPVHVAAASTYRNKGPTFGEFLQFIIEQHRLGNRLDEHWAPVYSFCTPCSINFTIIGKVESFQRDSEYIIRQAGLDSLLLGKLPQDKLKKIGNISPSDRTHTQVERYFSEIEREILDKLLNIYRLDFELFNYDYGRYYNMIYNADFEQMNNINFNSNNLNKVYINNNNTNNNNLNSKTN